MNPAELRQQLRDPDPALRLRAISEFARSAGTVEVTAEGLDVLREALEDPDQEVVTCTLRLLPALGAAAVPLVASVFTLGEPSLRRPHTGRSSR